MHTQKKEKQKGGKFLISSCRHRGYPALGSSRVLFRRMQLVAQAGELLQGIHEAISSTAVSNPVATNAEGSILPSVAYKTER